MPPLDAIATLLSSETNKKNQQKEIHQLEKKKAEWSGMSCTGAPVH
jgi:hypothetical protein